MAHQSHVDRTGQFIHMIQRWCVHRWIVEWNSKVDWFVATIFVSLITLIYATTGYDWQRPSDVIVDFATLTVIYLGILAMHNARQGSRLVITMLAFYVIAGSTHFMGILPAEGAISFLGVGLVLNMVFLYKLSRRRCRQAWCVDFTDNDNQNACSLCGLNERRHKDLPVEEEHRRFNW